MNTFVGSKIIKAKRMDLATFNHKFKNGPDPAAQNVPTKEGYHVVYPDNYNSWSPKDVFEQAYRSINWNEISLMFGTGNFTGASLIAHKRMKQKFKHGYDAGHDREHVNGELAIAGAVYALPEEVRVEHLSMVPEAAPDLWPWEPEFYKPDESRIEELVNAGALIAAEIDRRIEAGETPPEL